VPESIGPLRAFVQGLANSSPGGNRREPPDLPLQGVLPRGPCLHTLRPGPEVLLSFLRRHPPAWVLPGRRPPLPEDARRRPRPRPPPEALPRPPANYR